MNGTATIDKIHTWEIVRGILDRFQARTGFGIEWIADELSYRTGKKFQARTIYRYQEPDGLPIHHCTMVALSQITEEPAGLNDFAHRMNRAVIELSPPQQHHPKDDVRELVRAIKETTEAIEASADALEKDRIDARKWRDTDREIMEGVEELLTLRIVVRARYEQLPVTK